MIRAGKNFCTHCPAPQTLVNGLGNLVLGTDSEQTRRAAEELRRSRQVSKLSPLNGVFTLCICGFVCSHMHSDSQRHLLRSRARWRLSRNRVLSA